MHVRGGRRRREMYVMRLGAGAGARAEACNITLCVEIWHGKGSGSEDGRKQCMQEGIGETRAGNMSDEVMP